MGKERMGEKWGREKEKCSPRHIGMPQFAGSSTPGPWCLGCAGLAPGYREFWCGAGLLQRRGGGPAGGAVAEGVNEEDMV